MFRAVKPYRSSQALASVRKWEAGLVCAREGLSRRETDRAKRRRLP